MNMIIKINAIIEIKLTQVVTHGPEGQYLCRIFQRQIAPGPVGRYLVKNECV